MLASSFHFPFSIYHPDAERLGRVTKLEELPGRIDDLTSQVSQLRTEMSAEFSAVRAEMATEFGKLRAEMKESAAKQTGALRLSMAVNTIGQLLTAGTILGIVGRALKWF